jgi:hypothetical protein
MYICLIIEYNTIARLAVSNTTLYRGKSNYAVLWHIYTVGGPLTFLPWQQWQVKNLLRENGRHTTQMLVTTYTLTNIITHGHTIPNDH